MGIISKYIRNNRNSIVLIGEDGNKFTITQKEQKEIQRLTKNINQRNGRRTESIYNMVHDSEFMSGISYNSFTNTLENKGFITEKFSSDFTQFKSKADVKNHMKNLKGIAKKDYGSDRIDSMRYNLLDSVDFNYSGFTGAEELKNKISSMTDAELLSFYVFGPMNLIRNLYGSDLDDESGQGLVNKANAALDSIIHKNRNAGKSKITDEGWKKFKKTRKVRGKGKSKRKS